MSKKRLGKGLGALISDQNPQEDTAKNSIQKVNVDKIDPNPYQPRNEFNQERLKELSRSIQKHGLLQPITLRSKEDGSYQLIAGERRWRAAKLGGLDEIAAIIQDCSQQQMMEIALIENLQREDLDPIEEAKAYNKLIAKFDLTQAKVAESVGKSRSAIANSLRLLNLAPEIQKYVSRETLTVGHARALLALETSAEQKEVAKEVIENSLSVRETEKLVKNLTTKEKKNQKKKKESKRRDPNIAAIEDRLRKSLGTEVSVKEGKDKGQIVIEYYSDEELARLLEFLEA
ncbi:ParB/RepB/Spo0J family partition protein [Acetohalobium arabaticum]|uniref:Chromosome segregation DNA-binding protein n=1 Tax=Acetohalobium arabaticum (strain ATCC 49924 / DSM 5501 / Z-7288) TaxID=574087 RepID=D9QUM2_ACEAZ|nr:ParB/RepB/Spo0J family partition protein [Acetohalobium arabaticum]ADL13823.1 chromosome segregation DNA-binding protein [Acetohalobium arabaticum DSM 5501]